MKHTVFSTPSFHYNIEKDTTFSFTVWKFQILCEINFGDFRCAKSAIFTNSEALKFDFYKFLHFLKDKINQINQIQSPTMSKTADS